MDSQASPELSRALPAHHRLFRHLLGEPLAARVKPYLVFVIFSPIPLFLFTPIRTFQPFHVGPTYPPWLLLFAFLASYAFNLRIPISAHDNLDFALSEFIFIFAVMATDPKAAAVAMFFGRLLVQLFRGTPLLRASFNASLSVFAALLALFPLYAWFDPHHVLSLRSVGALTVFTVIENAVCMIGVVGAISLNVGHLDLNDERRLLRFQPAIVLLSLCVTLLVLALAFTTPLALLCLLPLGAFLNYAFRLASNARSQQYVMEQLLEASSILQASASVSEGVSAFLFHTRGILRCEYAELLLSTTQDFALDSVSASVGEPTTMKPVPSAILKPLLAGPVSPSSGLTLTDPLRSRRLGSGLQTLVSGRGAPLGALIVADRPQRSGKFRSEDQAILDSLSKQLSIALLNGQLEQDLDSLAGTARELSKQVLYDALTGLPNRTALADRLDQALHRSHRTNAYLAVMFLDLDGFKAVNDTFGHAAGDALLIKVGEILQATVRETDTVARLSGDEFVVLLESTANLEGAQAVAQRLLLALAIPVHLPAAGTAHIGASIGLVSATADSTPAALLAAADAAMYHAKQAGKGRVELSDT